MLNYFVLELNTELICDASQYGLFSILTQRWEDENKESVVGYASRSITEKEQRYSQIEKEALAIL